MSPTILGVTGPGFLNQVPTINPNMEFIGTPQRRRSGGLR